MPKRDQKYLLGVVKGGRTLRESGKDAFVTEGFSSWNKPERLALHMGDVNSFHNRSLKRGDDLMRQAQSIVVALNKQRDITKNEHRIRLNASIDVSRFSLNQGLLFSGHDESEDSNNQGNFMELIKYTASLNQNINNFVLGKAPGNNQMVSPKIPKDIVHCFSQEVIRRIIEEIGDDEFALLVDESSDVSYKEKMAVILRFVDKCGIIKKRFIGVIHVKDTWSMSLKSAVDSLFSEYGLRLKRVRQRVHDGASNIKGEFNGLRALISQENSLAYYVHYFAHQLLLVVVAISKKHFEVGDFFEKLSLLLNVVGASCKGGDMIREKRQKKVRDAIDNHEIRTRSGLNKELTLQRPANTSWGSHYRTLLRLAKLYPIVLEVLEYIEEEGLDVVKRRQANGLLKYLQSFDFAFYLQLTLLILGLTESLSMSTLQRKDQDILNTMSVVASTKRHLQTIRDSEWDSLMVKVSSFCEQYDIQILKMEEDYVDSRRPRKKTNITNLQNLQVDCFHTVVNLILQEFNDRFIEINSELLICMAPLSPTDYCHFDMLKLMRLAEFYPNDFDFGDRMALEHHYAFILIIVMVYTGKHRTYILVFRLLKLVLTLSVATTTVERCFSSMNIVKTNLRYRMADSFLYDCLICYIEKDLFHTVSNDDVIERFMKIKTRREQL
ncbi:hypothetical protein QQ045_018272 [Rhodiola kirilowii]